MRLFRIREHLPAFLSFVLCVPLGAAQRATAAGPRTERTNVTIRSIRAIPGDGGFALEIVSDHPLVPDIAKLDNPARVVIDLPNAHLSSIRRRLDFRSNEVTAVRIGQFQDSVARIVVDMAQPLDYGWDATGSRLMVRLHAAEAFPKASSVPALFPGASPVFVPVASADGSIVSSGNRLAGASSITAGLDTAVLSLGRGGEIRVCPGSTVSVTPSQDGRSLMLGMSTGALEAHYRLETSSDSILTPDFRMMLAGPGEFHYAISADPRGNTCVQALPGNTAALLISEVLGDGAYRAGPAEQVMFHSGQLKTAAALMGTACGCPTPVPALMQASSQRPAPDQTLPASKAMQPAGTDSSGLAGRETAALPIAKPDDVHVQVDVPLVFRANDTANPSVVPAQDEQRLRSRELPRDAWIQVTALPPPQASAGHRGFFGRVKGFFSAIFG